MDRKYAALMFICFIVGGFFLINFATQMYDFLFRSISIDEMNVSALPDMGANFSGMRDFRAVQSRQFPSTSPINLIGGIVLIISGYSIWRLAGEKDKEMLIDMISEKLLLPEEKRVIDELKRSGGETTQKELSNRTGIQKVKLHRLLARLEKKKIVRRYPYGMTRKVVIERNDGK
ncbi:MAG: MarR family transcriptional regulator [Candidatus Aenigmarchaeota archaeon]|nr:MarR family transcriptional regulator [Candidatus Aenigmarchaeota archaeon]